MTDSPRYAARCAFLRMTLDSKQMGIVVNLCEHIIREGSECVGPFLDDTDTHCRLWEEKPGARPVAAAIATPLPSWRT